MGSMQMFVCAYVWMLGCVFWEDVECPADKQSSREHLIETSLVANCAFLKALQVVDSLRKEDLHIWLAVSLFRKACNLNNTQENF